MISKLLAMEPTLHSVISRKQDPHWCSSILWNVKKGSWIPSHELTPGGRDLRLWIFNMIEVGSKIWREDATWDWNIIFTNRESLFYFNFQYKSIIKMLKVWFLSILNLMCQVTVFIITIILKIKHAFCTAAMLELE